MIKTKALFLDRDGIINIDKGYVYRPEEIEFTEGAAELLKIASGKGFELLIITNQAGIARGMYTEEDVDKLHLFIKEQFRDMGIRIKDFFYCPHHPDFTGECDCRKPNPGMIKEAAEKYGIDLSESVMIGDKKSDIEAGINAGVKTNILVKSPYSKEAVPGADFFAENVLQAGKYLRENF